MLSNKLNHGRLAMRCPTNYAAFEFEPYDIVIKMPSFFRLIQRTFYTRLHCPVFEANRSMSMLSVNGSVEWGFPQFRHKKGQTV